MARQDYFTHFEPSQSQGGAKTEDPRDKPPDHPRPELGSNPQRSLLFQGSTLKKVESKRIQILLDYMSFLKYGVCVSHSHIRNCSANSVNQTSDVCKVYYYVRNCSIMFAGRTCVRI